MLIHIQDTRNPSRAATLSVSFDECHHPFVDVPSWASAACVEFLLGGDEDVWFEGYTLTERGVKHTAIPERMTEDFLSSLEGALH